MCVRAYLHYSELEHILVRSGWARERTCEEIHVGSFLSGDTAELQSENNSMESQESNIIAVAVCGSFSNPYGLSHWHKATQFQGQDTDNC